MRGDVQFAALADRRVESPGLRQFGDGGFQLVEGPFFVRLHGAEDVFGDDQNRFGIAGSAFRRNDSIVNFVEQLPALFDQFAGMGVALFEHDVARLALGEEGLEAVVVAD